MSPLLSVAGVSAFLLGWLAWRSRRERARLQAGADVLRRQNADLAARLRADASTLQASHERLHASEARWRAIVQSAVDGIIVIDAQGRIESFNNAAETLFGYAERDVIGQSVSLLMPSPHREEHDGYIRRYLETGHAKIIGLGREVTGRRRDGTIFPLHLAVGEVILEGERRFTGILHDLTTRVQMEEQLSERAALARIGELAAVIAHEIKNPLAGIKGAIQVIGTRLPEGSDAAIVTEIVRRIDALDDLTKDLLLFARPPKLRIAPVDVIPLLTSTAGLVFQDSSMNGIHVEITGSAPPVAADAEMLKIVFHNLLVNSAQAMRGRGRIDVAVETVAGACQITFTDNGPGIPHAIRDKVFQVFFTTKARGTGLGLPTARRVLEAHGGDIRVESPPDGGTRFTVRLPARPVS